MADQKDFNSLDDLFRKTFDDLPDMPGASGWDQPGDRVWQHVQARIKPPQQGWATRQWLLAAGAAVTIAVGLYLAFARPTTPVQIAAPADKTEQAATPAPEVSPETATTTPPVSTQPERPTSAPAPKPRKTPAPAGTNAATVGSDREETRPSRSGSAPLPGSRPEPPNTTERRKNDPARKNSWNSPLAPLPGIWEKNQPPKLPATPGDEQKD